MWLSVIIWSFHSDSEVLTLRTNPNNTSHCHTICSASPSLYCVSCLSPVCLSLLCLCLSGSANAFPPAVNPPAHQLPIHSSSTCCIYICIDSTVHWCGLSSSSPASSLLGSASAPPSVSFKQIFQQPPPAPALNSALAQLPKHSPPQLLSKTVFEL